MQKFLLFFGERDSLKDEVFDMLPQLGEKQLLYSKIIIKQYQYPNKLLINFPDVMDIEQEIHYLLSLTQISNIHQFAIFLNYDIYIVNKMENIKKKIMNQLNYPESNMFTFFVNKSQNNSFDKKNRVYYVQNWNSKEKEQIQDWFKQNTFNYIKMCQLKNKGEDLSTIFDDAQFISTVQQNSLESHLLKLLNYNEDQTITGQFNFDKKYTSSFETEFYCDLILLSVFAIKNRNSSNSKSQCDYTLVNIQYCYTCSIIYQKISNGWRLNQIYLFKFSQQSLEDFNLSSCVQCCRQLRLKTGLSFFNIIQSIYQLQLINSYYKKNVKIFQCKKTLKDLEQEKQNEYIERRRKALALMLISSESQQKSLFFQKTYKKLEYTEQNQFIQGKALLDKFYLIDSPIFCFDEDINQTEALFTKYLNNNPVHFIFYCINYQRTSLMKERVIEMLKSFPNVNKDQMGIVILNENITDYSSEQSCQKYQQQSEIIKSMQGILKQVILIRENDDQNDIIEKIQSCIGNIEISQELSFKDTIFGIQEDDESQIQLFKQLQQITDQVENNQKLQEQQQQFYYSTQSQLLQSQKQELENKLNQMNQSHKQKIQNYKEIIQQTMQKMNEEKVNFYNEQKQIQDKIQYIEQQKQNHQDQYFGRRQLQQKY